MNELKRLADINIESLKLKKMFIDCSIHGEQSESLLNGLCRACRDKEVHDQEQAIYEKMVISKKRDSGVMERYLSFTLSNYPIEIENQATMIESLLAYDFNNNIVMLGKVGTGKTRIGCSLVDKAIRKSISAYYVKYYQLTKMAIEDKAQFKRVVNSGFLVIDEFGVSDTDYKSQLLFEIFDQRYDKMLPTMLISNLTSVALKEKIGDALFSRIKENCISFNCNWDDYRLKGK